MKNYKIVFLGQGLNASKTLDTLNKNKLVNIVFCAPRINDIDKSSWFDNGKLSNKANKLGIKLVRQFDLNSKKFVDLIYRNSIDLIVNLGHGQLFKPNLIKSSKLGILNYHPGLLPQGRGSGAVVGEIMNNVASIGRTCHLVDENFDLGTIISQEEFEISDTSTLTDAYKLLTNDVDLFINRAVEKLLLDTNKIDSLNNLGFGRYYPKFVEGDDFINWNDTSVNIYNKVRSRLFERSAVIYTKHDLKKFLVVGIRKADYVKNYISVNGQVIDKSSEGVLVKTNDSAIWITKIIDSKSGIEEIPKFKIGTCFQTLNISDFIKLLLKSKGTKDN